MDRILVAGIAVAIIMLGALVYNGLAEGAVPKCPECMSAGSAPGGPGAKAGLVFTDPPFSFQLTRAMGNSVGGMADIGECLSTAERIKEGDFEGWFAEWNGTASRIEGAGDGSLAKGHNVSARDAYLRASTYYRLAEFYLHGNPEDPRILATWNRSRAAFRKAAALSSPPIEAVEIPYENTTLPGYFYPADGSGKARRTLLLQTGFDGIQEELYVVAKDANARGYNVLTFEGPGQGQVIREQGLPFRADWEAVITPVVDYAAGRNDVDSGRLALYGISLGGYLAPRGAAYEPRIKALIANGGVYDPAGAAATVFRYGSREDMLGDIGRDSGAFDRKMRSWMNASTGARWFLEQGMFAFREPAPSGFLLKYAEMTLNESATRINASTLILDSENDGDMPGQAKALYDRLACEKEYALFTAAEGAGQHTQAGAIMLSDQVVFDWLDETFDGMDGKG